MIGLYFSRVSVTENGFLIVGLEIFKSKDGHEFFAQELRYHEWKGWEEVLYTGKAEIQEEGMLLHPNSCQVRANVDFGEKKGLVRRFDCTHLHYVFSKGNNPKFQLSSSLLGTLQSVPFDIGIPGVTGEPIAISFLLPGSNKKEEGVWGFHLNGIGTNHPIQIWNPNLGAWERFRTFETLNTQAKYHIYRWKRSFSD